MKDQARVVVIGGGVVGCSILFHLAKMGWKDVHSCLKGKSLLQVLAWHAAGNRSMLLVLTIQMFQDYKAYTIRLYKEIEETSGHSIRMHKPSGGYYLASNEDWDDYLKRERSKARYMRS